MAKIEKTVVDSVITYTETETTLTDGVVMGITGALKALSNDKDIFYSEDVIGVACLINMGLGVAAERAFEPSRLLFP